MMKRVATVSVLLLLASVASALAQDTGRPSDVRAIRAALPLVLANRLERRNISPSALRVDTVHVTGADARASWHAGEQNGIETLRYTWDRWWDMGSTNATLPARPGTIAARADGYTLHFALPDAVAAANIAVLVRAPDEAESWHHIPGGNAWAYFTITSQTSTPSTVPAGSTLTLACPFVLDDHTRYLLTIAGDGFTLGPIEASVSASTLRFSLPAFTEPPKAELHGEVDGDPI